MKDLRALYIKIMSQKFLPFDTMPMKYEDTKTV